jgi:predicted PurR-regulated permease PerM
MLHVIAIPLLILSSLGVGFALIALRGVLIPFVVALFFSYLLRPIVNAVSTPFVQVCICCVTSRISHNSNNPSLSNSRGRSRNATLPQHVNPNSDSNINTGGDGLTGPPVSRPPRAPSPQKPLPLSVRGFAARMAMRPYDVLYNSSNSSTRESSNSPRAEIQEEECGCCVSPCRFTRCPRWFGVLVSLCVAMAVLSGLILMIADAIQRFQQESLGLFADEASQLVNRAQAWLLLFGIKLEGAAILDAIKQQITVPFLVQTTVTVVVDGIGNALLVLLLVLYLLAEASTHQSGSLRAKLDDSIVRYIGLKTVISAIQGSIVYVIMGTLLHVRMSHLWGVIHFFLNYIPTAGPIVATIIPLPVIMLDPALTATAKIAAFVGPSLVHFTFGNFVEPMVFGSSLDLHPVVVLLALALWYALWGVPGAILAVPITAVLRIVMAQMDHPYAHIIVCILEGRISAAMEDVSTQLEKTAVFEDDAELGNGGMSTIKGTDSTQHVGSVGKSSDVTLAGSTQQTIGSVTSVNGNGTRSTKSWDNERDALLTIEEDR